MHTCDDTQFTRFWWECLPDRVGRGRKWVPYAKGGSALHFYARNDVVLNWDDDGTAVKTFNTMILDGGHWSKNIINSAYFFRPGFMWQKINVTGRCFAELSPDHIISHSSLNGFPRTVPSGALVAYLNSSLVTTLKFSVMPERKWEVGLVASLPVPKDIIEAADELASRHVRLSALVRQRYEWDETCRDFGQPPLLDEYRRESIATTVNALQRSLDEWYQREQATEATIADAIKQLDARVFELCEISVDEQALIRDELARRPLSEAGYSDEELEAREDQTGEAGSKGSDVVSALDAETSEPASDLAIRGTARDRDLVSRLMSHHLREILKCDEDGIVPVWPTRTQAGLWARLHQTIKADLGEIATAALVVQAPAYLGSKTIAEWMAISGEETPAIHGKKTKLPIGFFLYHVNLYRKRPIFWLVSSEGFERGRTRFRFQAYLNYLKLTPDTLRRLLSHHLEPAIEDFVHKEWADARARATRLEGKPLAAANAETQEWLNTLDALKSFRTAVEAVIQGPKYAERVPESARWLARTIAVVRGGQDLGHGYTPDVDYGVRVNIAPFVEKKLLPKLAVKKLGG